MAKTPLGELFLNPSARVLWRSPHAVQLELGDRAVVLQSADGATVRQLAGLDVPPDGEPHACLTEELVASLQTAGFLLRRSAGQTTPPTPRLAADLAALRIRHGQRAIRLLERRRRSAVAIHGDGRIASFVGSLLAAAGVGRIVFRAARDVRLCDAVPGGLAPKDEGERFARSAAAAAERAAPECDTGPLPARRLPDLVVLALDGPVDSDIRTALHAQGSSHLATQASGERAAVGPLVLPGLTSCLRCADLHRLDRDEAWPALAVQLSVPPRHTAPSDVAVASLVGSVTALQALAYLDGEQPATLDGTLEFRVPDWRIRRRSWSTHPDCDCGAHAAGTTRSAEWPA